MSRVGSMIAGSLMLVRARRERVHIARTEEERAAVFRLRYRVFVEELKRRFDGADHDRRLLTDADDDDPSTIHFYVGTAPDIVGCARLRRFPPGAVPEDERRKYSLDRLAGIERLVTGEVGRLVIRNDVRGTFIMLALAIAGYEHAAGPSAVDVLLGVCAPGLVRRYRQLGWLPYGRLVETGTGGIQVPTLLLVDHVEHFRRCGSPVAPLVKKYFGPGKRPPIDRRPIAGVLAGGQSPVDVDAASIARALEIQAAGGKAELLSALSSRALRALARSAFILRLEGGQLLIRKQVREQEVYLLLEGALESFDGDRQLAIHGAGEVVGEVAFFTESGERSASVRAVADSRVLVLRRRFLEELASVDPRGASQVLLNMDRILARRLARATSPRSGSPTAG